MQAELEQRLAQKVKEKIPSLNLTAEDISQITIITLSVLAEALRKRLAFSGARLLRYARGCVKSFLESD